MIEILNSIPETILAATATGAGNAYALPPNASQVTWQSVFATAPAAAHIHIEVSNDNSAWAEVSNSSATVTTATTFNTSALFIRANLVSKTGGSTFSVILVAKSALDLVTPPAASAVVATTEFPALDSGVNSLATGAQIKAFTSDDTALTGDTTAETSFTLSGTVLNAVALPVYADEAAAAALATGDFYQTAAGALRIKL